MRDCNAPPSRRLGFFPRHSAGLLVRAQLNHKLLGLAVPLFGQLRAPQLAGAEIAVYVLPTVDRLLRDPHPADPLRHRRIRIRLLQRERDLLLNMHFLLHVGHLARRHQRAGKLSLSMHEKTGRNSVGLGSAQTSLPSPVSTAINLKHLPSGFNKFDRIM